MNTPLDRPTTVLAGSPSWSVAGLLLAVSDALAARFAAVSVRGELSGFTRAASGHCYFTLKDASGAGAALRCAMFRRAAQGLGFVPRDGQQVEVRGRLAVYEARGELQMVAEAMLQLGAGNLYEEFLRLRDRLQAQGLFDAGRKRALPAFPQRMGLVTSASGAALHDVLTALARRAPQVEVVLCPTPVQGAEAPLAIVAALSAANQLPGLDVIVVCRGGGSLEDLWAFNDERVVRAVAQSRLPVVSGVGHETDVTLVDLAADLRAATPTAAAELVAPSRDELLRALAQCAGQMGRRVAYRLENAQQRLDNWSLRLQRPGHVVSSQAARLVVLGERHRAALHQALLLSAQAQRHLGLRFARSGAQALERQCLQAERLGDRLRAVDPKRVLARGYAWVASDEDGRAIVSSQALKLGQRLRAVWADGEAVTTVTELPTKPAR
jgi:exodeoxyribonuclease VII large subunit